MWIWRRNQIFSIEDDLFAHIKSAENGIAQKGMNTRYNCFFVIMLKHDVENVALRNAIIERCIATIIIVFDGVNEDV